MRTLLLIRHASTVAVRRGAFPADEPLDAGGREAARALRSELAGVGESWSSPAARALETAAAAGLRPAADPALDECDFGSWRGRGLAELDAEDPRAVRAWIEDPGARPHGGESLHGVLGRVAAWLDRQAALDGTAAVVTHGGVVKAAVVHALRTPVAAFWQIEAAPLGITELRSHDGRWTVTRLNARAARSAG